MERQQASEKHIGVLVLYVARDFLYRTTQGARDFCNSAEQSWRNIRRTGES